MGEGREGTRRGAGCARKGWVAGRREADPSRTAAVAATVATGGFPPAASVRARSSGRNGSDYRCPFFRRPGKAPASAPGPVAVDRQLMCGRGPGPSQARPCAAARPGYAPRQSLLCGFSPTSTSRHGRAAGLPGPGWRGGAGSRPRRCWAFAGAGAPDRARDTHRHARKRTWSAGDDRAQHRPSLTELAICVHSTAHTFYAYRMISIDPLVLKVTRYLDTSLTSRHAH